MNGSDNRYYHPAVPPLYPMDPCRRTFNYDDPIYDYPVYEPYNVEPIYNEPYYDSPPVEPNMPYMDYSMMDPHFKACMEICMRMRCGNYPPYHKHPYSNEDYENSKYIDLHKLSPYYIPDDK